MRVCFTVVLSLLIRYVKPGMVDKLKNERFLTSESDYSNPCVRDCVPGENMVCNYTFIVDWYTSMSVQCGDCPHNLTDCSNPGCIVGGGIVRPVISVNRRTPGPALLVCENDTIHVQVTNAMDREMLTIHWHGIHQVGSPFMDGAPHVTQCPIPPGDSFKYSFVALPHGTHMWHGHVGFHDSSGLFGPLVVRRPEPEYIQYLYDYDLPEHTITVWHWYNETDQAMLPPILDTFSKVFGYGLLINGQAPFGKFQSKTNATEIISTPRAKFFVEKGKRYRFRLIVNSAIYCPVQVSIDNHTMLMMSSDTNAFEPLEVESLMVNAGERFGFVVNADQDEACYWMRFRGLGDCGSKKSSTHGEAFLCYNGTDEEPHEEPTYDQARRPGKLLNPVEVNRGEDYSQNELVMISDLRGLDPEPYNYSGRPHSTLYVELQARLYYEADAPGPWPQFNNMTFEFPPFSMLSQRELLGSPQAEICDDTPDPRYCLGSFCSCTYVKKVPLDALVEIVMVDVAYQREQDHPIHLHGYKFHVVATGVVGDNVTLDQVKELNENGLIDKQLVQAPFKDTISVPNAGYAVIRFKASNPGFWLFHCHVTNHLMLGMGMVIQVGEHHEMLDPPPNFPICASYLYDADAANVDASASSNLLPNIIVIVTLTFQLLRMSS